MRSEELVTRLIARSSGRLWRKGIQVQPVRKAWIGGLVGLAGDHAGPVGSDGGQIDLRGTVRIGPSIKRLESRSGLPEEDQIAGPALGEQRHGPTHSIAERQRIDPR